MLDIFSDDRLVMTLDAGGTNFVFNAIQKGKPITEAVRTPSYGDDLEKSLKTIIEGFTAIKEKLTEEPVAISFAFPGPADYTNGIIGDLTNLPGYRGGVALGSMLEEHFGIPVFIKNDGDLYAYGEALGGILPTVNKQLADAGSSKRYNNLVGLTLGTGFGAGFVLNGQLINGDNSIVAEIWNTSNSITPERNSEEGVSARAVANAYNRMTSKGDEASMPKDVYDIAVGEAEGDKEAALKAFAEFGTHLGDAVANLITLFDGLVVIGGGITASNHLYMPAVMDVVRGAFKSGQKRAVHQTYLLDDASECAEFLKSSSKTINIPFSEKTIEYDPVQKVAVATSQMDASDAIVMGAYAYALTKLDEGK